MSTTTNTRAPFVARAHSNANYPRARRMNQTPFSVTTFSPGTLCATTSKTPPMESPVRNAWSTSAFMRCSESGSAQLRRTSCLPCSSAADESGLRLEADKNVFTTE